MEKCFYPIMNVGCRHTQSLDDCMHAHTYTHTVWRFFLSGQKLVLFILSIPGTNIFLHQNNYAEFLFSRCGRPCTWTRNGAVLNNKYFKPVMLCVVFQTLTDTWRSSYTPQEQRTHSAYFPRYVGDNTVIGNSYDIWMMDIFPG